MPRQGRARLRSGVGTVLTPTQSRITRIAGAALALVTAFAMVYRATRLPLEPYLGMSERDAVVALITPGGPADKAGLMVGDRIVSIDGQAVENLRNPSAALRGGGLDRSIFLSVERDRTILPLELMPEPLPRSLTGWALAHAAVSLAMLLIGTIVFLQRTGQLTIVFFGICLALANLLFRTFALPNGWGSLLDKVEVDLFSVLLPALLLHFFLLFPYRRQALQRFPWLHVLPYLPGAVLLFLQGIGPSVWAELGLPGLRSAIETAGGIYTLLALILSVVLFAQAYRRSPLPTIRRKLTITLVGTLLGLLPLVLVLALHSAFPALHVPGDQLATLMLVFLPASFGYAILRHGIFEIEFIVKRSLVYSGMTASLVLAYFVAYFGLSALLHNVPGLSSRIGSLLAVLFAVLLMSPIRGRIQMRLDRWVYPDRYEIPRALREAAETLRQASGLEEVERAILQSVRRLLGVEQAGLFHPAVNGGGHALAASLDPALLQAGSIHPPALGRLLAEPLFREGRPISRGDLEAELPYGFLPREDLDVLRLLQAQILIPLTSGSRRLGILVLGPRSYQEPYTPPDLELLQGLQAQAALAMDNAHFARESEGRAVLQREMEVARSLQQQLLPTRLPQVPFLEIAATNLPCHEIGGDYYDCLQVDPSEISLAIGDVSGKGVPAALLMANVQATFHAEIASGRKPHEVLEQMNRRLCRLDRPERFVSFFCGRLDLHRRQLSYANAGHLQPMLVRADGSVDRLDAGGLLLGIQEHARYEGEVVPLRPGDLLVLFTDGLVERGGADTLFGEPDLQSVLFRYRNLSASDLMGRVLEELQRLTGQVADDDTTVMILKAL